MKALARFFRGRSVRWWYVFCLCAAGIVLCVVTAAIAVIAILAPDVYASMIAMADRLIKLAKETVTAKMIGEFLVKGDSYPF